MDSGSVLLFLLTAVLSRIKVAIAPLLGRLARNELRGAKLFGFVGPGDVALLRIANVRAVDVVAIAITASLPLSCRAKQQTQ